MMDQSQKPPIQKVITYSPERWSGENNLEYEVKLEQLSFYRWGAWVWRLTIILFVLSLALASTICILTMLGYGYIALIIKDLLNNIPGS